MIALALWIAGGIAAWLWWIFGALWAAGLVAMDAGLKACGMVFLFERASRWWKGA